LPKPEGKLVGCDGHGGSDQELSVLHGTCQKTDDVNWSSFPTAKDFDEKK
jgi:hypothetical protein